MRVLRGGVSSCALTAAFALVAASGAAVLAPPCLAATVDVHLHDPAGRSLSGIKVTLWEVLDERWARSLSATSEDLGVTRVESVPVGTWAVTVSLPRDSDFIRFAIPGTPALPPSMPPTIPAPRVTVSRPDETVSLDVVLQRGDAVFCELDAGQDRKPGGKVNFVEIATGARYECVLGETGYGDRLLPPGRWRTWLEPRAGELLQDFQVDHASIPDSSAVVETRGEGRRIDLYWRYASPCRVTGRITWDRGELPPGNVIARLDRPGEWLQAVKLRGGTVTDRVPARMEKDGHYEMFLLDGAWSLVPEGDRILSSEPASVAIDLKPGEEGAADFALKVKPDEDDAKQPVLLVDVMTPDRRAITDAYVAIWPLREGAERGEPLPREATGKSRSAARFVGLPSGNYLVAAGHRDYLEGRLEIQGYEAVPDRPKYVMVFLRKGGEISALALDENRAPARGVELRAERVGDPAPSLLNDPELAKERAVRRAVTNETGRLRIPGFDPGTYTIEGALSELREGTHFIEIEKADPPGSRSQVTFTDNETREVTLHLVPAASVRARLACLDRGPLPPKTAVRLLDAAANLDDDVPDSPPRPAASAARAGGAPPPAPGPGGASPPATGAGGASPPSPAQGPKPRATPRASAPAETPEKGEPRPPVDPIAARLDRALFKKEDVILTGSDHDMLLAGPLHEGALVLALRPEGFDRWTFAPGSEDPDRAVPQVLEAGKWRDIGIVDIDCGPTVRIEPRIGSGDPLPDLHDATLTVTARRVTEAGAVAGKGAGAGEGDGSGEGAQEAARRLLPLPDPRREVGRDGIRLRGLAEGTVSIEATLSHPCFIPPAVHLEPRDLDLVRGREARIPIEVPRLGGALQFDEAKSAVLALLAETSPDASRSSSAAGAGGPVRFELDAKARAVGVPAGRYRVELFSDTEGTRRIGIWADVDVRPGRILVLR